MGVFLIILNQITHQSEGMLVRRHGRKYGSGGMFFNAIICLFAAIFFIVKDVVIQRDGLIFTKELVMYGLVSCIMFATGFYALYIAFQMGSYAMTRLVNSFSGVISILCGVALLGETVTPLKWVAIALVFVSSFVMKYQPGVSKQGEGFSVKWLVFVLLSAISNGLIAVLQRMQQKEFNQAYNNEFMIISFVGAAVILLVLAIIKEREKFASTIKTGMLYGFAAGSLNGASNFLNLAIMDVFKGVSIATPIRSGAGLVTGFLISIFIYKEKLTIMQLVGAVIGIGALVLFAVA